MIVVLITALISRTEKSKPASGVAPPPSKRRDTAAASLASFAAFSASAAAAAAAASASDAACVCA